MIVNLNLSKKQKKISKVNLVDKNKYITSNEDSCNMIKRHMDELSDMLDQLKLTYKTLGR